MVRPGRQSPHLVHPGLDCRGTTLVARYAGNSTVIGCDLRNELADNKDSTNPAPNWSDIASRPMMNKLQTIF